MVIKMKFYLSRQLSAPIKDLISLKSYYDKPLIVVHTLTINPIFRSVGSTK